MEISHLNKSLWKDSAILPPSDTNYQSEKCDVRTFKENEYAAGDCHVR